MVSRPLGDASRDAPDSPPVLVVDEDRDAAAGTLAALAPGGYHAVREADGDAALRYVRGAHVRLVVSELYIKCGEGACVVTVLKGERQRLPRLRVLVYTQHQQQADVEWALATGCDGLVFKSAAPGVLVREVARLDGAPYPPRLN